MTVERCVAEGPSWRSPQAEPFEEERTLVVCRCGVDMEFMWPRGRDAVRCFGCGARFPRPRHLDRVPLPAWAPPPPAARALRSRPRHGVARLVLLGLTLLAGGALLLLGVRLLFG